MDKRKLPLVLFLLVLLTSGCAYIQGYLDIARDRGVSQEYLAVLNSWTRSQVVYSQFETQVRISATFKGREFQKAYLKEYGRMYQESDEEKKKREKTIAQLAGDYQEIFFYAYVPEKDYNDFEKQRSVWSVFMTDKTGKRIEPMELRKVEKVTPVTLEFFPYVNPHHGHCYSLKIPPVSDEEVRNMKLVFTGVVGRVELAWK